MRIRLAVFLAFASQTSRAQPTFTHVHLAVADVTRSSAFYREKLALKQVFANDQIAAFELAPQVLLMIGPGKLLRPAKVRGEEEGITLSFQVTDLDATYASLRAKGVPIPRRPKAQPWGGRNFFAKDPDGYTIEYETLPSTIDGGT